MKGDINAVSTRVFAPTNDNGITEPIVLRPEEALDVFYTGGTWQGKGFSIISIDEAAKVEVNEKQLTDVAVTAIEIGRTCKALAQMHSEDCR